MRVKWLLGAVVAVGALSVAVATSSARVAAHERATPTISLRSTSLGKILVNSKGVTLYLWVKDKKGKSVCTGACLDVWPLVLITGKPVAGPGVNASKLGEYKYSNGKYEVTYYGHPLYTFTSDLKPGQTTGQGNTTFGGAWWVVGANGKAITKKA